MSHGDPNWQLPGEPVTRRVASSATGSMLCVGYRVYGVGADTRDDTGVLCRIPDAPCRYVTVEWPDGSQSMHLPERLLRIGDTRANEQHAERWLAQHGLPRAATKAHPPAIPDPPAVEHDRHYVQVAFDEPTVQLLTEVLAQGIAKATQIEEATGLSPRGQRSLQLTRRARAQLLYAYAQWLEGPA